MRGMCTYNINSLNLTNIVSTNQTTIGEVVNCTHFTYDWADFEAFASALGITYHQVIPTLMALGILGNLMNWFTFSRKSMKSPGMIYFCALVKVNILSLLCWIPLEFGYFGVYFTCPELKQLQIYLMFLLYDIFSGISNVMLIIIGLERYVKICHPMKETILHSKHSYVIVILVWILVIAIAVPKGLHFFHVLNFNRLQEITYTLTCDSILRVSPAAIVSILVTHTILSLRKVSTHLRLIPSNVKFEKQLTSLLLSTCALYSITVLPAAIATFYSHFLTQFDYTAIVLTTIPYVMELAYYSLGFYIYISSSALYRLSFCCCIDFNGRQTHRSSKTSLTDL